MHLTDIIEALRSGSAQKCELFPEGSSRWAEIRTAAYFKPQLDAVRQEANRLLQEPILQLPFSLYKLYDETGSRKEYEKEYFKHRLRLNTFAIMALADDDPRYLHALEDAIWAICDEYTWCLPAHHRGNLLRVIERERHERTTWDTWGPEPREHRQNVDLFAAETGFALAEITHLLDGRLAELVAYRARREIRERVLEPYAAPNQMFWWETCTNNWAAVCAGSVGAAAMYLIRDDAMLAPFVSRVLGTMDSYLRGFEDDGACTEGISYWTYGFGFFTYFAALLEQRTAGRINLLDGEKVKNIALFQQKCYLNENFTVSFSDASLSQSYIGGLTHFLKTRFDELEVPDSRYCAPFPYDNCNRWGHAIRCLVWTRPDFESLPQNDASYWLEDAEWLISRKTGPGGVVAFAAKGGHNDEPHNHNDVGTFILHIGGETLLTDTGAGEYTKAYFGPERYSILCNRSMGHSVPIVEGGEQQVGRAFAAEVRGCRISEEEDVLALDIAKAYGNGNLLSLVRTFRFAKTGHPRLTLTDEFRFAAKPTAIVERFVSFCEPEPIAPGEIRIRGSKRSVSIFYEADKLEFGFERAVHMDHGSRPRDLYLLDFTAKSTSERETFRFEFGED
ncbi:heparinase II/III domain-containing protein [Paenibacillus hamazuiensis]|uniref:heparinase II/III domain-containing protein n=1 Tax=Paenibacillus hamazuiensis TaxID=2936508 RepID=UPI00200D3116|nr:heparinase II/III family protein [Paenibacillus hamazuiensis]